MDEWALPTWTDPHAFPKSDSDPRDPLRAQASIDALANGLFHSSIETGPGITSLTDHLVYLVFHGWAESFAREEGGAAHVAAYRRLFWLFSMVNYVGVGRSTGGRRWVVYGVQDLQKRISGVALTLPARWSDVPPTLVQQDTRARYAGLWQAIPPANQAQAVAAWRVGARLGDLRQWATGSDAGLNRIPPWLSRVWSLKRVGPLRELASWLQAVEISSTGLGFGLPPATLGLILAEISRHPWVQPDTWMLKSIRSAPSDHRVRERLRRAALGRAIIYAANWEFYRSFSDWRDFRPDGIKEPVELMRLLSGLVDETTRQGFRQIDAATASVGFSLIEGLEASRTGNGFYDWVMRQVHVSGKDLVEKSPTGHWRLTDAGRQLVDRSGRSLAGGMRLHQGWRLGKDIADATQS